MSHAIDECYAVYDETRRVARVAHRCGACDETVQPGHTYWRVAVVFEKRASTYKRCERCQAIHLHLREMGAHGDTWPAEALDCGEDYAAHWGAEPPEEIAALAFALPGETRSR